MPRRKAVKTLSSDSSDDEPLSKKCSTNATPPPTNVTNDTSSESDIADYLQPADKIDLDAPFFNFPKTQSFDQIEKDILAGVSRLSGSDSDSDRETAPTQQIDESPNSKLNFQQLHEYTRKLEEVRKHAEVYNAKKRKEETVDISNLLAAGEKQDLDTGFHSSDFDSEDGWEEVADEEQKDLIPKEGVQITVDMPGAVKKKKGVDLMAAIKRRINRVRKEHQVLVHKVHLLCWIAHGNHVSSVINSQSILAVALSLLPSEKCYPADRTDLTYLEQVVKWYRSTVINVNRAVPKKRPLAKLLESQITKKEVYNKKMLVYVFVAIMRSLGIQCRVVLSLQVEPIRPSIAQLCSLSTKRDSDRASTSKSKTCTPIIKPNQRASKASTSKKPKSEKNKESSLPTSQSKLNKRKATTKDGLKIPQLDGADDGETSKPNLKKLKTQTSSCPKRLKAKPIKYKDTDSEDEKTSKSPHTSLNLNKLKESSNGVNLKNLKNTPPGQSRFFKSKPMDVRHDIVNLVKSRIKEQKQLDLSKMVKKKRRSVRESDENSDHVPEGIKKKRHNSDDELTPKVKVKRRVPVKPEEQDRGYRKDGVDVWAEVFLETEEKWISVDLVKGQVHCVSELFARATHPVSYILAWDNNNRVKDITRRYCHNFNTVTRRLRVDSTWWEATLKPYLAPKTAREREEDEEFDRLQLEKPLPTSIAEYKNHPLYVLKRHLLKFQALYPPDTAPVGFIKSEAVYPRRCVHSLHSREVWLKQAKVVKPGETPYKIVKARARYDRLSNTRITDQTVEIFGLWQTEEFVPPTAEDGVVPRNAFGNVELFKSCMLPRKTVHLQLPGLNKIARRLEIDCAPAVVGFDFHSGGSHPTFDGFVVCEEYADMLVAAWELEQEELAKREREKVEKRVYGNWRKLIRGLLIRERLKVKYEFGEFSGKGKKKKA